MKETIKALLPDLLVERLATLKRDCFDGYAVKSYSQEGEDMILRRIYEYEPAGFYVDVGAHHPKRFSNTYYFYKKGWSGINIDAMPGSMSRFNRVRPRDINIEAGVACERKELTFHIFSEPALNTFDENLARERVTDKQFIVRKEKIYTKTLAEILTENLPKDQKISFMSIDVEGLDMEVVQSNNWEMFRPEYVLVECYTEKLNEIMESDLYKFMTEKNYEFFAKSVLSIMFKKIK